MIKKFGTVVCKENEPTLITDFVFEGADSQAASLDALHWAATKIQAVIEEEKNTLRKEG